MPSNNIRDGQYVAKTYETLQNDPQFGGADRLRKIFSGADNNPLTSAQGNPYTVQGFITRNIIPQPVRDKVSDTWKDLVSKHEPLQKVVQAKDNAQLKYNQITDSAIKTDFNWGQKIIDKADKINVGDFKATAPDAKLGTKISNMASNKVNQAKSSLKDGTKSLFTDTISLPSNIGGSTAAHTQSVNVSHPSLTAPIAKASKFVKPVATALAISYGAAKLNQYLDEKEQRKKAEKAGRMEKSASEEVAAKLKHSNDALRKIAMTSIAYGDKMISSQKLEIEKLAAENCILKLDTMAEIRYKVASDLSNDMVDKGLIPPSEYERTLENIISMDDTSYDKFVSLLQNVQKVANDSSENLTSDVFNFNIKEESPVHNANSNSMEDAIINL